MGSVARGWRCAGGFVVALGAVLQCGWRGNPLWVKLVRSTFARKGRIWMAATGLATCRWSVTVLFPFLLIRGPRVGSRGLILFSAA